MNSKILYCRSYEDFCNFSLNFPAYLEKVFHFPLIDALGLNLTEGEKEEIKKAEFLIFSSPKAVKFFDEHLFLGQKLICLGEGSFKALKNKKLPVFLTAPSPFNSEALLKVFSPLNKKIIILAAKGGRDFLEQELGRKNQVKKIFNYQRINPSLGKEFPQDLEISAVMISSLKVLENMIEVIPSWKIKLIKCNSLIIVPSERVFEVAKNYGFEIVLNAKTASDLGQITALNLCLKEKIYD